MNVDQLRSFLAVMVARSFHRAAEMRHLSQPSLSQQIQRLEAELGVQLFDRTHRPVVPTEAANVLDRGARRVLRALDDLAAEVRDADGEARGAVAVGAMQYLALLELPETLAAFHAAYPLVELQLRTGTTAEVREKLLSGEVSVGLLHAEGQPLPGRFRSEVLRKDELVVICSRTHELASLGHVDWADLTDVPFITFRSGASLRDALVNAAGAAGFRPRTSVESADVSAAIALVEGGLGAALVPRSLARNVGARVASLTVGERSLAVSLIMARDGEAYLSRAVAAFMDVARSHSGRSPDGPQSSIGG